MVERSEDDVYKLIIGALFIKWLVTLGYQYIKTRHSSTKHRLNYLNNYTVKLLWTYIISPQFVPADMSIPSSLELTETMYVASTLVFWLLLLTGTFQIYLKFETTLVVSPALYVLSTWQVIRTALKQQAITSLVLRLGHLISFVEVWRLGLAPHLCILDIIVNAQTTPTTASRCYIAIY
jgi:hypothetical protein